MFVYGKLSRFFYPKAILTLSILRVSYSTETLNRTM